MGMFGVYTPGGALVGHYPAGEASLLALDLGEGARVISDRGAYVVRDGALRMAAQATTWEPMPPGYVSEWMADAYGGCLN